MDENGNVVTAYGVISAVSTKSNGLFTKSGYERVVGCIPSVYGGSFCGEGSVDVVAVCVKSDVFDIAVGCTVSFGKRNNPVADRQIPPYSTYRSI